MAIGVLALQGDVREHAAALSELGEQATLVRRPQDLAGLEGIILPGGESTTLSMLLESSGLFEPLGTVLADGLPVLGTCAGLVLLATRVLDGRADQRTFGLLDCSVRRNGYGRQLDSFEASVDAPGLCAALEEVDRPVPAVFIRAPVVVDVGPDIAVLGSVSRDGIEPARPVICRQGSVLVTAFHPELTTDRRVHRLFLRMVANRGGAETTPEGSGARGRGR
jgi:5'-phosphate synthase pdxT subunit